MSLRLIALDLDGTLLDEDKAVSEPNARALRRAAEKGIRIVISSGRILPEALRCVSGLEAVSCISACNGAFIKDLPSGATIYAKDIERAAYAEAIGLIRRFGAFGAVYGEETVYLESRSLGFHSFSSRFMDGLVAKRRIVDDMMRETADATWPKYKIFSMAPNADDLAKLRFEIEKVPGLESTRSSGSNVEIMAKGVNKGDALRRIASFYGVPRDAVVAIGDEENDIPMFSAAGIPIAMGNADPHVKRAAARVTLSNAEDGVAEAIGELIG